MAQTVGSEGSMPAEAGMSMSVENHEASRKPGKCYVHLGGGTIRLA